MCRGEENSLMQSECRKQGGKFCLIEEQRKKIGLIFLRMNPWSILISQRNSVSQRMNVSPDFNVITVEGTGRCCCDLLSTGGFLDVCSVDENSEDQRSR